MVETTLENGIYRVTLNRPEVRNAFNDELIQELHGIWDSIPSETRAIVLTGSGSAFCAGADLNWMKKTASYTQEQNKQDALSLAKLLEKMANSPAPLIARVNGNAFGGGCGLVAAADIAIASSKARFAFSEVKLGLIPATISRVVIDKIGRGYARHLFLTGESFNTIRAMHIGLIHEMGPEEQLDELIQEKIDHIMLSGPEAILKSRELIYNYPLPLNEAAERLAEKRSGDEGREGVSAFLEKRKAGFVVDKS